MKLKLITIISMLLILFSTIGFSSANIEFTDDELKWIEEHNPIKIGVDPDYAPFEFINEQGKHDGVSADYFKWLENNTNLKFEIVYSEDWSGILLGLKSKEIDLNAVTVKNIEREEYLLFSNAYMEINNIILTSDSLDSNLTLDQMDGMNIGVIQGYASGNFIQNNYPKINLMYVDTLEEGVRKVSYNMIDAFIGDLGQVAYYIKNTNITHLKILDSTLSDENLHFAIRDDYEPLLTIINKSLKTMPDSEKANIQNRWLAIDNIGNDFLKSLIIIIIPIIIFLIVITIIVDLLISKKIKTKKEELNQKNHYLTELNSNLESIVLDRTKNIEKNLNLLSKTQNNLIESEKMADLNELILSLSAEINTTISSLKASADFLNIKNIILKKKINANECSKMFLMKHEFLFNENINLLSSTIRRINKINYNFNIIKPENSVSDNFILDDLIKLIYRDYSFKYSNIKLNLNITTNFQKLTLNKSKKQLKFIITELIDNSLFHGDYAENNSNLNINLNFLVDDNNLTIISSNNITTIDNDMLIQIFNPFFTTTGQRGSVGLGLFIIKNIINSIFQGSIVANTNLDTIEFKIVIPLD